MAKDVIIAWCLKQPATIVGQYTLRPHSFSGNCYIPHRHVAGVPPAPAVAEESEEGITGKER